MAKINSNDLGRIIRKANEEGARLDRENKARERTERSFTETREYCCHSNNPLAKRRERQTILLMSRISKVRAEARREANIRRGLIELQA